MKAFREAWMQARRRKLILGIVLAGMLLIIFLFLPEEGSGFEKNFFSVLMVGVLGFWIGLVIGDRFLLYPLEGERDRLWREAVRDQLVSERPTDEVVLLLGRYHNVDRERALFIRHWLFPHEGAPIEIEKLSKIIEPFVFARPVSLESNCLALLKADIASFDNKKQVWMLSPRFEKFLYGGIFLRKRSWLPGDPLILKSQ